MAKATATGRVLVKKKIRRKGVHSKKKKNATGKNSRNYRKAYRGQGR